MPDKTNFWAPIFMSDKPNSRVAFYVPARILLWLDRILPARLQPWARRPIFWIILIVLIVRLFEH